MLEKTPDRKKAILTSTINDWTNKLNTAKSQLKSVPTSKRSALLANIADLQSKVRAARSALASVQSKTVSVRVNYYGVGDAALRAKYAHGGIVGGAANGGIRDGMVWVGEQGPELVSLPSGSNVIGAGQSRAMAEASSRGGNDGAPMVIQLVIAGHSLGEIMIDPLRKAVWTRGGDVQAVLGRG
jgi:phage-related tail protein